MAQALECLPSKGEALSSNTSITKKKKKRERERVGVKAFELIQ
jgi:hypothetical protein